MVVSSQRLTVRAGDAKVAMAASSVSEVIRAPRLTRMPHGPPSLLGVTHLRGQVLPVISLGSLLGQAIEPVDRVVVLRRDPPVGLAVDGVEALRGVTGDDAGHAGGQLLLDDAQGARWFDLGAALEERFAAFRSNGRSASASALATQRRVRDETTLADLAYLAFELAGQAYALAIDAVVEVGTVPAAVAAMPRTDDILLGVSDHRAAVLPIVSLRTLLGLPPRGREDEDRLIITRVGDQTLGLVVDRVSAILRAPPDRLGPAPSFFNRGEGEARIDAVLRLPDGRGLVSVLSPEKLLADERLARLLNTAAAPKETAMAETVQTASRQRFVVLRLGDERYGLPIAAVDEVVRAPEALSRLPKAPAYVQGVMNLRGRVIPVIDQRQRFSVAGERSGTGRVVVVTIGGLQAGFAVDSVDTILEAEFDELLATPDIGDGEGAVFDRAIERDGEVVLLIDPQALLDRAEADLLRDLTAVS